MSIDAAPGPRRPSATLRPDRPEVEPGVLFVLRWTWDLPHRFVALALLATFFVLIGGASLDLGLIEARLGMATGEQLAPYGQVFGNWDPSIWPGQLAPSLIWALGEEGFPTSASVRWPAAIAGRDHRPAPLPTRGDGLWWTSGHARRPLLVRQRRVDGPFGRRGSGPHHRPGDNRRAGPGAFGRFGVASGLLGRFGVSRGRLARRGGGDRIDARARSRRRGFELEVAAAATRRGARLDVVGLVGRAGGSLGGGLDDAAHERPVVVARAGYARPGLAVDAAGRARERPFDLRRVDAAGTFPHPWLAPDLRRLFVDRYAHSGSCRGGACPRAGGIGGNRRIGL